ncbi:homeodomain-interacting protein kinase 4-like [Anguilla rostrata]|uniref:homeodomain-interacting protein kinase 4-like n=1 Tax=Anguilla rostrata TaxID=7938 RepID=UPI0030CAFC80
MILSSEIEIYEFVEELGHGMFSDVASFRRKSDRKIVAVKRMSRVHCLMGIREARLLAALTGKNACNHHIVRFYEGFADRYYFYIVEEAMEMSLTDYQKANALKRFRVCDIRTVVLQVLVALAKLKEMGIVHADIKQENIMLVNQRFQPFRVKLVDFGSSMTANELAAMWTPYIQPRFIRAPEVLLACPCTAKIDMWSLGCVMGEMALGRMVFPSLCDLELAHSIFGTRGLPSPAMLKSGIKTKMFFDWVETGTGARFWLLKPYKGRELLTGTQSLRRHAPANLDLLQAMEQLEHGSADCDYAELADRRSLVDLLDRMLTLEPEQRVCPDQALQHPFLTLKHLSGRGKYRAFYALQAYREAGVCPPQERSSNHEDSSEESDPEVPRRKRRSVGRLLRSFFSRLFSRRRKKQPTTSQGNEDALEGPSSSAAPGGQPAHNPVTTEEGCTETAGSSSAPEESEECAGSSGSPLDAPEEPPKKRGFLRWLRTRFSTRRGKKSDAAPGSSSSSQ